MRKESVVEFKPEHLGVACWMDRVGDYSSGKSMYVRWNVPDDLCHPCMSDSIMISALFVEAMQADDLLRKSVVMAVQTYLKLHGELEPEIRKLRVV